MAIEMSDDKDLAFPAISDLKQFDKNSGSRLEKSIFNYRKLMLFFCTILTLFLGFHATKLTVNANFERMIPQSHPYIKNYFENKAHLRGLSNAIRIVVENKEGDIYDKEYLQAVQKVTDRMYLQPGVDRAWLKSLWMPFVRWMSITERGVDGGPLMPENFDFSPTAMDGLKHNVSRSSAVGSVISKDMKSSLVYVPLLDRYPDGKPIDYGALGRDIESKVRSLETDKIKIHVVGFGKLVGDMIEGLKQVFGFFAISAAIATLFVYFYTRCVRSTLLLVTASLLGVVWLLGLMHLLGYELDPYSILVPFLIFSIGLSHGAQKMNGVMQDIGRGSHKYVAARYTFRRLFVAGLAALLTNVVGFAVLVIIDIPVIRDMAITTSIGVSVLIFTKLILIPVMLSYIGVSEKAAKRSVKEYNAELEGKGHGLGRVWPLLVQFTLRKWAIVGLIVGSLFAGIAFYGSLKVQYGDINPGAPELRQDSRYNRDMEFVTNHFGLSSDQFATIVKMAPYTCHEYKKLELAERLGWKLRNVDGVEAVVSLAEKTKYFLMGNGEGFPKQFALPNDDVAIGPVVQWVMGAAPDEMTQDCAAFPVIAYLSDHKAGTLDRTLKAVEAFAEENNSDAVKFLPAAGSAGIEAISNIVVRSSNIKMLVVLYLSVIVLCYITFRSWRAVVIALLPLVVTSLLCEALMVWLGIGIKVSTLPVIALGVGVGVDYALYLLGIQLTLQRTGESLTDAYRRSLGFTGRIVALVALTMAASVVTWAWSPIKFQADMGILLAFMFLWNMVGALIGIPALSHFLLQTKTVLASTKAKAA